MASLAHVDRLSQLPVSPHHRAALWALRRWERFPVAEDPRPLVLTEAPLQVEGGFVDQQVRDTFAAGALVGAGGVADQQVQLLRQVAGVAVAGRAGSPAATAPPEGRRPTGRVLEVRAAQRDERRWGTDRGRLLLPCWQLTVEGAVGPVWLLDAEAAGCWSPTVAAGAPRPPGAAGRQVQARVERDGTTMHVSLVVAGPDQVGSGGCDFITSATAAVALPADGPARGPEPRLVGYQPFDGYRVELVGHLAEPLGRRVLVDLDGSPVPVESEAGPGRR